MALPDYSGAMTRNQIQRQRKKENRQQRRTKRATAGAVPTPNPVVQPQTGQQEDYTLNTGTGYQGVYQPQSGGLDHPFYDPNASYAKEGDEYFRPQGNSALERTMYDNDPAGYYYGQLNRMGYGGMDAKSQAAQGLYKQYQLGYSTARTNNNWNLHWDQYLAEQDIQNQIEMMSDEDLGIDRSRYGGRDRWQLRGNY